MTGARIMTKFEAITESKEALIEYLTHFNDIAFFVSEETCKRYCNRICDKCSKTIDENMNEYLCSESNV